MSSKTTPQLWRPGMEIRFSPKSPAESLYPDLGPIRPLELPRQLSTKSAELPNPSVPPVKPIEDCTVPETTSLAAAIPNTNEKKDKKEVKEDKAKVTSQESSSKDEKKSRALRAWDFLAPGEAPKTTLDYGLSQNRFDAAQKAAANKPESYWSHTLYEQVAHGKPRQNVKVHYCTSKHTMESVCKRYFQNEPVLGFDMEWMSYANKKSGPRVSVSLIQIASPGHIALFHIAVYPKNDFVAPTFKKIMEDTNVKKAGVNILADATRLRKALDVDLTGIIEVSHLYNLIKYTRTRRPGRIPKAIVPMSAQVKECLGLPIYKGDSIRSGPWMSPLNAQQLKYAASDAYAGLQLYHVLDQHRLQLKPCPPQPHYAELRREIQRADDEVEESSSGEDVEASEEDDFIDDSITDEDLRTMENSMITNELLPKPTRKVSPTAEDGAFNTSKRHQQSAPQLSAADASLQRYTSRKTKLSVRPSALRAYFVWHDNKDLKPAAVAALLRDPPLQTNTVVTYIVDAIIRENLPYSDSRMGSEVLPLLHPSAVQGRYQALAQQCGFKSHS
ncbi:3'-5' exonuclease domain-containing protein [Sarocladium implicatum]|nr:3'-5' exonuclease domain-containing protein [Sarocladium implicatum]